VNTTIPDYRMFAASCCSHWKYDTSELSRAKDCCWLLTWWRERWSISRLSSFLKIIVQGIRGRVYPGLTVVNHVNQSLHSVASLAWSLEIVIGLNTHQEVVTSSMSRRYSGYQWLKRFGTLTVVASLSLTL